MGKLLLFYGTIIPPLIKKFYCIKISDDHKSFSIHTCRNGIFPISTFGNFCETSISKLGFTIKKFNLIYVPIDDINKKLYTIISKGELHKNDFDSFISFLKWRNVSPEIIDNLIFLYSV